MTYTHYQQWRRDADTITSHEFDSYHYEEARSMNPFRVPTDGIDTLGVYRLLNKWNSYNYSRPELGVRWVYWVGDL